jgi:hypothetical protein
VTNLYRYYSAFASVSCPLRVRTVCHEPNLAHPLPAGAEPPYGRIIDLRETRRAIGMHGYRLEYGTNAAPVFQYFNKSNPLAGFRFSDSVAMGDFLDDVHRLQSCSFPAYLRLPQGKHPMKAFYVPFRALTVDGAPNLLTAGKTMAQTFHANAATRLHPCEWSSGVAAGAAAVLMIRHNVSSTDSLNVSDLQIFLNSSTIAAPLEFDQSPAGGHFAPGSGDAGQLCAFGRCVGVDNATSLRLKRPVFEPPGGTCNATCPVLGADEWLANCEGGSEPGHGTIWNLDSTRTQLVAIVDTTLKKSFADSLDLPAASKHSAMTGTHCTLVSNGTVAGYMLCRLPSTMPRLDLG